MVFIVTADSCHCNHNCAGALSTLNIIVLSLQMRINQHYATEPTLNMIFTIFAKQEGDAMVIIATELHCIDS